MDPERWKQVDSLLQSVLERPPEERDAFLRHACAGDEALEREVRSLLTAQHQAGSFLESPAMEVAARVLALRQDQDAAETNRSNGRVAASRVRPTSRRWFLWLALLAGGVVFGCYAFGAWLILRHGEIAKPFGWKPLSATSS